MTPRVKREPIHVSASRDGASVRVVCSECAPSINQITSMVPMQRANEARRWRGAVADGVRGAGPVTTPVRIEAVYYWSTRRRRDLWNYAPKWAVDGLVDAGVIPDDDASAVSDCVVRFEFDRSRQRMELVVSSLAEPPDGA